MFVQSIAVAAAALSAVSARPGRANHVTTSFGSPTAVDPAKVAVASSTTTPTSTYTSALSKAVSLTGVTHTAAVGRSVLKFDPDNVVAEVGDTVEWHYLPANHSVVQSSFDRPCHPLKGHAFNSNFFPVKEGQSLECIPDRHQG